MYFLRFVHAQGGFESSTYGNLLQNAGYITAYFGKYLNPPAMEPYCKDGGTPNHPVNSGEFKVSCHVALILSAVFEHGSACFFICTQRLPGWDHQLTMCNTEYFNVTWNLNGTEIYTVSPLMYSWTQSELAPIHIGGRNLDFTPVFSQLQT
jgi:hypothetical protein